MAGADVMTLWDGTTAPIPEEGIYLFWCREMMLMLIKQGQDFGLADYYAAEAVYYPQLDTYRWVSIPSPM